MIGNRYILRGLAVVLLLVLAIGWGMDRIGWQRSLGPLETEVTAKRQELDVLQARMHQKETFDGFDSVEEVFSVIENTYPERVFERQAQQFDAADDAVFHAMVPQLIDMLDHNDPEKRQRAWRLLQNARESPRFERYEADYLSGLAKLLQHHSIVGFNKLLPWLRDEGIDNQEILAGLHSRMMDDEDPFAPYAAYVLAALDPSVDIAPRLEEMIEQKHSQWRAILHRLPGYMPQEKADALFEQYQDYR
ncbi:hypothetical protein AB1K70_22330 [Bremerella sp. JC770]|uniref:hypothetical protein n=1 Tax=Bremerella sp. JC770 TaxID=3232137 RepID=UPI0034575BEC